MKILGNTADGGSLSVDTHGPATLAEARLLLHRAMATGQTAEVDRLSSLCFAFIRRGR